MYNAPVAKLVQQLLVNFNLGVLSDGSLDDLRDWQITTEMLPDNLQDNVNNRIMVHQSASEYRGRFHDARESILIPRVQLLLRSRDEDTGRNKGTDIYNALKTVNRNLVVVDSVSYIVACCHILNDWTKIKQESKNFRILGTMNYKITFDNY